MATGEQVLRVSSNAIPVSTNDPFATSQEDLIAGRLKITPGGMQFPDLLSQQTQQQFGNLYGGPFGGPRVVPSVSSAPNVSPFPLGCPTSFYQSGNVCVPYIDTYPSDNPLVGGHELPHAVIQQVIPPPYTTANQNFPINVMFQNTGAPNGKFFLRVMIPSMNIDQVSPGVNIPGLSNGSLWIQIMMPANAPTLTPIAAVAQVSHLDQNVSSSTNGQQIVDDSDNFTIPGPGSTSGSPNPVPNPTPGGPPATQCIELGGIQYCLSQTKTSPACLNVGGQFYCPNCFNYNNQPYCQNDQNHANPNCIQVSGHWYCPSGSATPSGQMAFAGSARSNYDRQEEDYEPFLARSSSFGDGTDQSNPGYGEGFGDGKIDEFICTIPRLVDYAKTYAQRVSINNLGKLIRVVKGRGLHVDDTAMKFNMVSDDQDSDYDVHVDGRKYRPQSTHRENLHHNGSIWLDKGQYCRAGEDLTINGTGYAPGEDVSMDLATTVYAVDRTDTQARQHHGSHFSNKSVGRADDQGNFHVRTKLPLIPRGTKGHCIIGATGARSLKLSSKDLYIS